MIINFFNCELSCIYFFKTLSSCPLSPSLFCQIQALENSLSLSLSLQIQTLENFLTQTLSPLHQKPLRLYIYSYLTPSLSLFLSHFLSNKTNLNHTTKQTNSNGLKNTAKCNATTNSYAISWNQLGERSTSHQASKSN